jgi:hypothetical protein
MLVVFSTLLAVELPDAVVDKVESSQNFMPAPTSATDFRLYRAIFLLELSSAPIIKIASATPEIQLVNLPFFIGVLPLFALLYSSLKFGKGQISFAAPNSRGKQVCAPSLTMTLMVREEG